MGGAIIFVVSLAGLAILSLLSVSYYCHCFLHVLTESSGGIDEIRWPDEVLGDWWWKPLYCLGLLSVCATTFGVPLALFFLSNPGGFLVAFPILLWLTYPVCVLGPLAAHNFFMVLYPPFLGQLARHPRALLTVVLVTLPLPIAAVATLRAVFHDRFAWVLAASIVLPAAVLFYARAWGRLAWLVLNERRRKPRSRGTPANSPSLGVSDPWSAPEPEIPEMEVEVLPDEPPPTAIQEVGLWPQLPAETTASDEVEDEWSPHKKPYQLTDEDAARRAGRKRQRPQQPVEDGYGMTPDEPPPLPTEAEKYQALNDKDVELKARAERKTVREYLRPPKPTYRRALGTALFGFLFYSPTLRAWLNLAALTLGELLFLYLALSFWPAL
jgi:hypothetical protein